MRYWSRSARDPAPLDGGSGPRRALLGPLPARTGSIRGRPTGSIGPSALALKLLCPRILSESGVAVHSSETNTRWVLKTLLHVVGTLRRTLGIKGRVSPSLKIV